MTGIKRAAATAKPPEEPGKAVVDGTPQAQPEAPDAAPASDDPAPQPDQDEAKAPDQQPDPQPDPVPPEEPGKAVVDGTVLHFTDSVLDLT